MSAPLRVVAARPAAAKADLAERVRLLQAEARQLAGEHVDELLASLAQAQRLAEQIALGGEAYPAGVRDIARRLAEDSAARVRTLEALMDRRAGR
ncbi:MAG: hypothetical protein ACK4YQ_18675 [Phenylobacterium sp.]|uniref:hypothetical protein n=1 Tax=Phenylobacterium sp. TaxID=1871053 RepID=UPI00391D4363